VESLTSHNPTELHGLLQGNLYFYFTFAEGEMNSLSLRALGVESRSPCRSLSHSARPSQHIYIYIYKCVCVHWHVGDLHTLTT
jgi:hypothetical protein